jgi:hypothetical protein
MRPFFIFDCGSAWRVCTGKLRLIRIRAVSKLWAKESKSKKGRNGPANQKDAAKPNPEARSGFHVASRFSNSCQFAKFM